MPLSELNIPPWLNSGEPAGAPMLRGVQAGSMIATNFMRRSQEKQRASEQAQAFRLREQQLQMQSDALRIDTMFKLQERTKMELQLGELYKDRNLKIRDTVASPDLLSKVTRAVASGIPADPIFEKEIGGWLENNVDLLGQPKTTAFLSMWHEAKKGQKTREMEDLKHSNEMLELGVKNSFLTDRTLSLEDLRQTNRESLAKLNGSIRQEMVESRAKLHLGKVGVDAYVNRWLGTVMRESGVDSRTAMRTLMEDFYSEDNPFGATKPGAAAPTTQPEPAAATPQTDPISTEPTPDNPLGIRLPKF